MTYLFHRHTPQLCPNGLVRNVTTPRRAPARRAVLRCRWLPAADGRGLIARWEAEEPRPHLRRGVASLRPARHNQPARRAAAAAVTRAMTRRKD